MSKYLPTDIQKYIHISKYSRWRHEWNRRETWEETVDRYIDFWKKQLGDSISEDIYNEIRENILTCKVMPSMRTLMTAGKALERDHIAGYNPVVGTTKVLTKEYGYVQIKELENKSCHVLNINGEWAYASFKCYGIQEIYEVELRKNSNTIITVECSDNHRWYTTNGEVKPTIDLLSGRNGDKLPYASWKRPNNIDDIDYKIGLIHGLIFGDGTGQYTQERLKGYTIRICSDIEDTLRLFEDFNEAKITYPESFDGDPVIQLYGTLAKTHDLKSLPSDDETDSYMIGFFRGWLAADGTVGKSVSICLNEDYFDWFLKNSAKYGYVVQHTREFPNKTNFGKRKKRAFEVVIDRTSLTHEDFILPRKRDKFNTLETRFSIVSVKNTGRKELVYCAEVPDTNTFVLEKGLVTGNCTACAITHPAVFSEAFYILMNGCGFGFSVERQYINKLPEVAEELYPTETTIIVRDSKIGWATALKELISMLYNGQIPKWDLSKIRPAGAILKTFGGRSSGPQALDTLLKQVVNIFQGAKGRKLTSIECHDIICYIAEAVIVGSVRRSATISMSNLTDDRMRRAKDGQWWFTHPQRAMANNSVAYTEKPDIDAFSKEWRTLYKSKSGERGIWNKVSARKKAEECGREVEGHDFITNPCFIGSMRLLTCNGYESFESLAEKGDICILDEFGFTVPSDVWCSGEKEVIELKFRNREPIICTPDHVFKTIDGSSCEAKNLKGKRLKPFDLKADINDFEVVSIKKLDGKHKVYDFSEPQGHWGVVEGVIAHNCGETILRDSSSACNLSEVIIRPDDDFETIKDKIRIATIIGTMQATLTNFRFLRKIWKNNIEEERLLGVSLTGIMDHVIFSKQGTKEDYMKWTGDRFNNLDDLLSYFHDYTHEVNKEYAKKLGIPATGHCTVVKPSGCRTKESLVTTDDGILMLDEFEYTDKWKDIDTSVKSSDYGKLLKTYNNGESVIHEIKMNFGMSLKSTPNHKWMIQGKGWKRTDEIVVGDVIVHNTNAYKNNISSKFNLDIDDDFYCNVNKDVTFPDTLNPDIAWLCGYIYGDGCMCVDKSRFRFTDEHSYNLEKVKNIVKTYFNIDTNIRKLSDRNAFALDFGSRVLWAYFEKNGLIKTKSDIIDRIPLIIRKSSVEDIVSFFAGLIDSDGHVSNHIVYTTANSVFGKHIQDVLLSIGIVIGRSVNKHRGKGAYSDNPMYLMTISLGASDNEILKYLFKHSLKASNYYGNREANKHGGNTYRVGLVKSNNVVGIEKTFDVETESHWFWGGGFMSHNTVSILTGTSSGIHPRYGKYYIRRVRNDKKDPLSQLMIDEGIPYIEEGEKYVFSFYVKSPDHSVIQADIGAMQQLDVWKSYKEHWCDGNPSQTIYYTDDDYFAIADWLWRNWDIVGGISFFPYSGSDYPNAPLEVITEDEYNKAMETFPKNIRWDRMPEYEKIDTTTSSQEVACSGGACEL